MELKLDMYQGIWALCDGLNRTFMELKHIVRHNIDDVGHGLNRTFMELKQVIIDLIQTK